MSLSANRAALIVRATLRAYKTAIADGAVEKAAFRAACAIYRLGYPRTPEAVVCQMVAVILRRSAPRPRAVKTLKNRGQGGIPQSGQGRRSLLERGAAAAKLAYITAIADGAKPAVAFEVAKAAFRARRPEVSGERLDDVVARVLATNAEK